MNCAKSEFKLVVSNTAISKIVSLANEIWNEHYLDIIGQGQVDYMLDKFQSDTAISSQIREEDYQYYLVYQQNDIIGYLSYRIVDKALFLSKIYLLASKRGQGLGRDMMEFVSSQTARSMCQKIRLTVNRDNERSIIAYKKMGFVIVDEVVLNIGGGYVMDDYVMEKVEGVTSET